MAARKERIRVVLDTNVFVRNFKASNKHSPNRRVVRLWRLDKRLQLIVSEETLQEYLDIFADVLGMDAENLDDWRRRFTQDNRTTMVGLGRRYTESRDPDDNLMLATARAGKARYLVTNDKDLLDLPAEMQKMLPFGTEQEKRASFERQGGASRCSDKRARPVGAHPNPSRHAAVFRVEPGECRDVA